MRRTRLPSFALASLLIAMWGAASCILNPQPEPPGDVIVKTTGTTGSVTSGSGGSGTAATGTTTGGGPGTGGGGGSGGSGIVNDAGANEASAPPNDASADAQVDGSSVDGEAGSDGSDSGPSDSSADTTSDADATAVGSD